MVFTLLPTTALAEDTTGADETQPKTVAVDGDEKKTDPPAQEQPKNENPPAPEEPKTFTVTYTDGVGGAVFDNDVHSNLPSGTATPAFSGSLAREGYTFVGWNPAVAETVTADVTYAAKWEEGKTNARRVPLPTIPKPDPAPADLNTGHKIDVRFTVLYVGDEFNIGYNYGTSESTTFASTRRITPIPRITTTQLRFLTSRPPQAALLSTAVTRSSVGRKNPTRIPQRGRLTRAVRPPAIRALRFIS